MTTETGLPTIAVAPVMAMRIAYVLRQTAKALHRPVERTSVLFAKEWRV